ncbi:DUF2231 domain-containing protein [Streptomyces sp. NPDC047061]|uniref:DUF2231 domain-containing protein n=1 Tax=Streptomyces sp. NPDC047061 TaxID=3154605 RepID=UPI0033E5AB2A
MTLINDLPAHVLLVHLVVVLVPLTALVLVLAAISRRAARRMGEVLPLLALVSLVSVPLTTQAGEWLERHVTDNALVQRHAELGDGLLPWTAGLFVLAALVWWGARTTTEPRPDAKGTAVWSATPVRVATVVLSLAVAAGAVVDVYRIGDSGAKAAWHDGFSRTASHASTDH